MLAQYNKTSLTNEAQQQDSTFAWRLVNFIMAAFFLFAALANVNDDDWFAWVPIYFIPALLCLPAALKPDITDTRAWNITTMVYLVVCSVYGSYHTFLYIGFLTSKIQNPMVHEEGRELAGLLIVLVWLAINRFTSTGRVHKTQSKHYLSSSLLVSAFILGILPAVLWSLCFVGDWHTKIGHCTGMFS